MPTGTTGDLVIDFNSSMSFSSYTIFVLQNAISEIKTDSASLGSSSTPISRTVTCPAGGICIAIVNSNRDSSSVTWSGLTENDDFTYNTGGDVHSTAYTVFSSYQSSVIASATLAGTADASPRGAIAVASFR